MSQTSTRDDNTSGETLQPALSKVEEKATKVRADLGASLEDVRNMKDARDRRPLLARIPHHERKPMEVAIGHTICKAQFKD